MQPCKISPIQVGISTGVFKVRVLFRRPYCWEFMGAPFLVIYRRHHVALNFLVLWLLQSSYPPLPWPFLSLRCRGAQPQLVHLPRNTLPEEDMHRTKAMLEMGRRAHKPLPLAEKVRWWPQGRESCFSLGVATGGSYTCLSGWTHPQENLGNTNWTPWVILRKKEKQ